MRRILALNSLIIFLLAVMVKSAGAFGLGGDAKTDSFLTPLGCVVWLVFDAIGGDAEISLTTSKSVINAGGSVFTKSRVESGRSQITSEALQKCGYREAVLHMQNGADTDFPSDNYIGVVFFGYEPSSQRRFRYEWAFADTDHTKLLILRQPVAAAKQNPSLGENGGVTESRFGLGNRFTRFAALFLAPWREILLVAALISGIGFLYGCRYFAMLFIGFVQHRRACDIPAQLETRLDIFPGKVIALGLNGCRFHPANKSTQDKLIAVLSSPEFSDFDLKLGDGRYPVFVEGFHGHFSPVYFFESLTRTELKNHLKASKIAPYLVRHIGHRASHIKWRDQMAARRLQLKAGREARPYPNPMK